MLYFTGHWDGFQPFGNKKRSTGAIEVSIATMNKEHRLCTEEVYTVGFVPSYDLPDGRPNSLDPFLEPLMEDLEEGFIEGGTYILIRYHTHTKRYCAAFCSWLQNIFGRNSLQYNPQLKKFSWDPSPFHEYITPILFNLPWLSIK